MHKVALAALALTLSAQAAAQQGEVTLYTQGHFKGPSRTIDQATTALPAMTVKSVKVAPGTAWELCSGNTFTGCKQFSQSDDGTVQSVRSVRPIAPPIAESVALPSAGPIAGAGPSLKGLASEFFPVPAQSGSRVEAATSTASTVATDFCRQHGWRAAAYHRIQTIEGRTFLADVLCTRD